MSEDLYARVESENREGETLGETLERMVDDYGLMDFAEEAAEIDFEGSMREAMEDSMSATPPREES